MAAQQQQGNAGRTSSRDSPNNANDSTGHRNNQGSLVGALSYLETRSNNLVEELVLVPGVKHHMLVMYNPQFDEQVLFQKKHLLLID